MPAILARAVHDGPGADPAGSAEEFSGVPRLAGIGTAGYVRVNPMVEAREASLPLDSNSNTYLQSLGGKTGLPKTIFHEILPSCPFARLVRQERSIVRR